MAARDHLSPGQFTEPAPEPEPAKDWVYEGDPLESNYHRNRYGDDDD